MCGIAGCISKRQINRKKFDRMVDIVEHRGPDDRGVYFDGCVALGHRRLSIIDLSMDGHQPFVYGQDYIGVFNGEIYNYIELRELLIKEGVQFKSQTDTEVLIASYARWGEACVSRFNGMWAFLIYDKKKNIIFGSRDRFGVKPFYYTKQEGMLLIASEIKQLFEMLEQPPRANEECLLQYLIRGNRDYSEETMFRDVFQLVGGHNIIFDIQTASCKVKKYYDFEDVKETDIGYKGACGNFRDKFINAVGLRLRSDVPLGCSLSGGLDSSAIVCAADGIYEHDREKMHTVSSCFDDARYDEREYIEEVIKQTHVESHNVFPQEQDLFQELDKMIWHMDEPFGSTTCFAAWNVNRCVKDHGIKVLLSGQGSDEQLAGYTPFYVVKFTALLAQGKYKEFWSEWKKYKETRACTELHVSMGDVFKSSIASLVVSDRKRWLIKSIFYAIPKNCIPYSGKQIRRALKNEPFCPVKDPRGYIAAHMKGELQTLLHNEDRQTMAFSVEERLPFLDYELVEAIYAMPFDYKLRDGVTKAVLRDGLDGILPDKIKNRYSKLGYVTPEDQWINHNYEKYRQELEQAAQTLSKILDADKVIQWFDSRKGNIRRGDFIIWRIICAGHWARIFHVSFD